MKKNHLEFLFITIFLLTIFSIKLVEFPRNEEILVYYHSTDFDHYKELMKWFVGSENNETIITYQYPPLYPILLIPLTFIDQVTYLLFFNYFLIFLSIIPLFFISRKFLNKISSIFISGSILLLFVPIEGISLLPIILATFIFTWFIYFFIDVNKNNYCFWASSITFSLLIMTKYVFFYMLPFVLLWIFLNQKHFIDKFKKPFIWGLPTIILFSLWSVRNLLIHGANIRGMLGGYSGVISADNTPLNVFFNFSKILSIFSRTIAQKIFILYFLFFISVILIYVLYKKDSKLIRKSFDSKKIMFIFLLLFNLIIFIIFPGMMWEDKGFNIKYIKYFLPVYLIFPFILSIIMINQYVPQSEKAVMYIKNLFDKF